MLHLPESFVSDVATAYTRTVCLQSSHLELSATTQAVSDNKDQQPTALADFISKLDEGLDGANMDIDNNNNEMSALLTPPCPVLLASSTAGLQTVHSALPLPPASPEPTVTLTVLTLKPPRI
jgi:hypothetical protein